MKVIYSTGIHVLCVAIFLDKVVYDLLNIIEPYLLWTYEVKIVYKSKIHKYINNKMFFFVVS